MPLVVLVQQPSSSGIKHETIEQAVKPKKSYPFPKDTNSTAPQEEHEQQTEKIPEYDAITSQPQGKVRIFSFGVWYGKLDTAKKIAVLGIIIPAITSILVAIISIGGPVLITSLSTRQTPHVITATTTPLLTNTLTITPSLTPIPAKIIITHENGIRTTHACSTSTELRIGEMVGLEFSTTMTEDELGKLEWWTFQSGSEKKIGISQTTSYSMADEGGIIYVKLGDVIYCTLTIHAP